jgi:DNA topoisomerase IA
VEQLDVACLIPRFKRVISPGWKVLYGEPKGDKEIPDLKEGDLVRKIDQKLERKQTDPPPRYTEGTLLKTMEKLGLGTPATRAQIIETLKKRGYITTRGKVLIPTEKGRELVEKLSTSKVSSPEMTAEWERLLEEINLKRLGYKGYKQFLEKIKGFATEEVERIKGLTFEAEQTEQKPLKVYRRKRTYKRRYGKRRP